MFATLLGGLPRPPLPGRPSLDALVARAIEAQESAGLEPITDGRLRWPAFDGPIKFAAASHPTWVRPWTVEAWRFAAAATSSAVKQALPGPYTLGRWMAGVRKVASPDRAAITMSFAAAIRAEILALAEAGCPIVEIEERDAGLIGADETERRLFREAHLALTDAVTGIHLSLAIVGGNADTAGIDTILAAPYASLAVDLIDGPDNWRLVTQVPGDRGIVAGAMSPRHPSDDGPELLLWAAGYAASTNGRGPTRVGLGTAGSLAELPWDLADRKLKRLGEAARLASLPAAEAAAQLDPRAVDIRSAAAGQYVPRRAPQRAPRRPTKRP